jgi:hypothetical protein
VLVLPPGERGQELGKGSGGGVDLVAVADAGREGEGLLHVVVGVGPGGESAEVESVVAGQGEALEQAADEMAPVGFGAGPPLLAERGQGAGRAGLPIGVGPAVVGGVARGAQGGADQGAATARTRSRGRTATRPVVDRLAGDRRRAVGQLIEVRTSSVKVPVAGVQVVFK